MSSTAPRPYSSELKCSLDHASILLGLAQPRSSAGGGAAAAPRPAHLAHLLRDRLDAYHAATAHGREVTALDERSLQIQTGTEALSALECIAIAVRVPSASSSSSTKPVATAATAPLPPPLFGARDTKTLGMLGGVIGKWALLEPESPKSKPAPQPRQREPKIVEISLADEQRDEAEQEEARRPGRLLDRWSNAELVLQALGFTQPAAERSDGEKQLVAVVLPQLLAPLVRTLVEVSISTDAALASDGSSATSQLQLVFGSIQTATVISTLLSLLPSVPPTSPLRRALTAQLSAQLVRPTGVRALLLVLVGSGAASGGSDDDVDVRKLEMIRRVVETKPENVPESTYFRNVVEQMLAILRLAAGSSVNLTLESHAANKGKAPAAPPTNVPIPIIRAACYLLAHLLIRTPPASSSQRKKEEGEEEEEEEDVARRIVREALHQPLLPNSVSPAAQHSLDPDALATHLSLLSLLSIYAPPIPNFLAALVQPILAPLLSLLSHLAHPPMIVSNPTLRADALRGIIHDEADALVKTLAKGLGGADSVLTLAGAVERWELGIEFGRRPSSSSQDEQDTDAPRWKWRWTEEGLPSLQKVMAKDRESGMEADDMAQYSPEDVDDLISSALSPVDIPFIVELLKSVDRKDLSARLLLRWLDELQTLRSDLRSFANDLGGARRAVTRLQLVFQMVEHLDAQEILKDRPKEIIAFVAHALDVDVDEDTGTADPGEKRTSPSVPLARLAGLKVAEHEPDSEARSGIRAADEEEQDSGLGTGLGKDEMALTALTLLLAVLEADPELDMSNTPLLAVVYSQLDTLAQSTTSALIPPLAREARMVLSLRRASNSFATPAGQDDSADPLTASRAKYREALKLLQDPLLPVRAQGLSVLRSLVLDRSTALLSTDPALLPAVLDIFVQAIEEEDSFLYLNAVQGLSSLVDVFGKQVVGRLLEVYTGARKGDREPRPVGTGEAGQRELDKRLRIGETLVQVIQRAGEALAVLANDLIPPLMLVLRTPTLPIPLRASAITILATAVETAPTAFVPFAEVLTEACVTLLSVETVSLAPRTQVLPSRSSAAAEPSPKRVLIQEVDDDSSDEEESLFKHASASSMAENRPRKPEEMPDPIAAPAKHSTLRRAAAVFLGSLIRTLSRLQLEQREAEETSAWQSAEARLEGSGASIRMPFHAGGSGADFTLRTRNNVGQGQSYVSPEQLARAGTVLRYVSETDEDALVRDQTATVLHDLQSM